MRQIAVLLPEDRRGYYSTDPQVCEAARLPDEKKRLQRKRLGPARGPLAESGVRNGRPTRHGW